VRFSANASAPSRAEFRSLPILALVENSLARGDRQRSIAGDFSGKFLRSHETLACSHETIDEAVDGEIRRRNHIAREDPFLGNLNGDLTRQADPQALATKPLLTSGSDGDC
jgi:hypothetical protein